MRCVCKCGRHISGTLAGHNFLAASVALELLVWDRDRALSGGTPPTDDLIARGAECYQRQLVLLHGEGDDDPDERTQRWLEESAARRATRKGLSKRRLSGSGPPNLSESDMARLDPRHPETSFTGGSPSIEDDSPARAGLVEELERLHALREQGVLDDAELAAAKSHLLSKD